MNDDADDDGHFPPRKVGPMLSAHRHDDDDGDDDDAFLPPSHPASYPRQLASYHRHRDDDGDCHDEYDEYDDEDDGDEYYIEDCVGSETPANETLRENDDDDRDGRCGRRRRRHRRREVGMSFDDDDDDNDDDDDGDYIIVGDYEDAREDVVPRDPPSQSYREYDDDNNDDVGGLEDDAVRRWRRDDIASLKDDDDGLEDEGEGRLYSRYVEHGRRIVVPEDENDICDNDDEDEDDYDEDEECDIVGGCTTSSNDVIDLDDRIQHQWSSDARFEEEDADYHRRGADVVDERRPTRRHRDACDTRIDDQGDDDGTYSNDIERRYDECQGGDAIDAFLPVRGSGRSSESLRVIRRIESVMMGLVESLDGFESTLRGYCRDGRRRVDASDGDVVDDDESAVAHQISSSRTDRGDPRFYRNFDNIAQSRSFASICCVMSFIHQLLLSNRTTTTREVYYVFVTHFRNQRECDDVILDVARALGVSRRSLGLSASPKGWFCGCVEIERSGKLPSGKDVSGIIDGTALLSVQGLPITREWTELDEFGRTEDGVEIKITSKRARAILVIEKEGVYNRLSEERIFDRFPCILVTGKGYPDLATRALVSALHRELELPVIGLCDCNPYGISVLAMYHCAGDRMGIDGRRRYTVPIQWLGLRPSEVAELKEELPDTVFQKLTDLDCKRIASLLDSENPFLTEEDEGELRIMRDSGFKVELEALYWLGPDHMGNWVEETLKDNCDHA